MTAAIVKADKSSQNLGPVLEGLTATVRALALEGAAENTRRAYASDWRTFTAWCAQGGLEPLPALPAAVALYVAHLAEAGRKASTITRACAAIASAHHAAGLSSPTAHENVRQVMKGARRALGTRPAQKAPVRVDDLRAMVGTLGETLAGQRDRALLVVGFAGALRRSELVALDVADTTETRDGLMITIRRSKTDQEGAGHEVALPFGSDPATCPVRTLRAWLEASGITSGPVFRSITRHGVIGDRLTDKSVAGIVKRTATRAGLDAARFAGHSLRAGLMTASAEAGKPLDVIMRQSRHRSHAVALGYIRRASAFKENAAAGIGL